MDHQEEAVQQPVRAPLPSVRRLPLYLRVLTGLKAQGRDSVSCTHISTELQMDPTQVRKDLAITGIVGRPKVGYGTDELINAIEEFLGWKNTTDAFLVGVGNLGSALLGYKGFSGLGLNIIAAFDQSPSKIGKKVRGREVMHVDRLLDLTPRMHVHVGVVAVPAESAQQVAELMVQSGILAIWNFAPVKLVVPEGIIVERADFSTSLAALTSRLRTLVHGTDQLKTPRRNA